MAQGLADVMSVQSFIITTTNWSKDMMILPKCMQVAQYNPLHTGPIDFSSTPVNAPQLYRKPTSKKRKTKQRYAIAKEDSSKRALPWKKLIQFIWKSLENGGGKISYLLRSTRCFTYSRDTLSRMTATATPG